jgi:hypothetical protein
MRWTFGVEPLPQAVAAATELREVIGLLLAQEHEQPAVDRLVVELRAAAEALAHTAPTELAPRIGVEPPPDGRPYLDHARHIGAFNPCFPRYAISVDGDVATGTVEFPLAYEGPPGLVHGGFLAVFFDCVVQHHNCELGESGKTTGLSLRYRRPTPLLTPLQLRITRSVDDSRITSNAELHHDGELLAAAEIRAVAGDPSALPPVSARHDAGGGAHR